MRTWMKWAIAAIVVVVLAVVAGPFIYINFIKDDEAGSLESGCAATPSSDESTTGGSAFTSTGGGSPIDASAVDGTWTVGPGSTAGYRVVEVLFGQDTTAVGRTTDITGEVTVAGGQVTAATFEVDMTTITSPESRRDAQFNGRIMDTATFPTATFTLTGPAELPADPATNATTAAGELTLRGVTQPVTLDVVAVDCGDTLDLVATTDIAFADFSIPDPSAPGISTQDHGLLEVKLTLTGG
ncbi:MAG: YceI family protein [Ilumatobacteraceae bacterium]